MPFLRTSAALYENDLGKAKLKYNHIFNKSKLRMGANVSTLHSF
jgi:hypothetical protein